MEHIKSNLNEVEKNIERAAAVSQRKIRDIKIIAVSKTVGVEKIRTALNAGLTDFGENRVQELTDKYEKVENCRWHMIGHLQTNKVKYIIDKVELIQSVDSLRLAREIDKRAGKSGVKADILIQVNISGEETKFGISKEDVDDFLNELSTYDNIYVRGLMTIAPYAGNPEDVRNIFKKMRKKFIDIRSKNIDNISMDYLSMGMSNDYEVAIEEGANMVRIGTAIFGKRDYN